MPEQVFEYDVFPSYSSHDKQWVRGELLPRLIHRPMQELIERHAIFLPTDRFKKDENRFLIDLRIAHERGLFPLYFGSPPYSDAAAVCGGLEIIVSNKVLSGDHPGTASKWRRALLKLTKVSKEAAQSALLDLPEAFGSADDGEAATARIEIRLFEFSNLGRQHFY